MEAKAINFRILIAPDYGKLIYLHVFKDPLAAGEFSLATVLHALKFGLELGFLLTETEQGLLIVEFQLLQMFLGLPLEQEPLDHFLKGGGS